MSSAEIERARREAKEAEAALLKAMSEGSSSSSRSGLGGSAGAGGGGGSRPVFTLSGTSGGGGSGHYNGEAEQSRAPATTTSSGGGSSNGSSSGTAKSGGFGTSALSKSLGIVMLDSDEEDEEDEEEKDEEEKDEEEDQDEDKAKEEQVEEDEDDKEDKATVKEDEDDGDEKQVLVRRKDEKKAEKADDDDEDSEGGDGDGSADNKDKDKDADADSDEREQSISDEFVSQLRAQFDKKPHHRISQHALANTKVKEVALNRDIVHAGSDFSFSVNLSSPAPITNQRDSGRCWLFAALNLLRFGAVKKLNVSEFEFSQNFLFFWDKFERANYFLEAIITTGKTPVTDREVAFLLDQPLSDGGQWNMLVALIQKHGLVPNSVMPDTLSSGNSKDMNTLLSSKLREGAKLLRSLIQKDAEPEELAKVKTQVLNTIWVMLNVHLGTPPLQFDWHWTDKDGKLHKSDKITPLEFAQKYTSVNLDDYICLVHDPRKSSVYNKTYTVKHLGNVTGATPVKYLNVDIGVIKEAAKKALESGEAVWFGCDFTKMKKKNVGVCDKNLFEFETLYETKFTLTKEERLIYHDTKMTHAMIFTGVDIAGGKPRKWKVENSWGSVGVGHNGFWTINDNWFDEHVFEVAAKKSLLPKELVSAFEAAPVVLPPWDPMGALAKEELGA